MSVARSQQLVLSRRSIRRRNRGKVVAPVVNASTLKPYPITTPYRKLGTLWSLGYHTGEDHSCPVGSYALATSWGRVVYVTGLGGEVASWGSSYGIHVVIRTGNGRWDYMHAHLTIAAVRPGDRVHPGMVVGYTGMTGNSEGPHLHFEARPAGGRFGEDVNPRVVKRRPVPNPDRSVTP